MSKRSTRKALERGLKQAQKQSAKAQKQSAKAQKQVQRGRRRSTLRTVRRVVVLVGLGAAAWKAKGALKSPEPAFPAPPAVPYVPPTVKQAVEDSGRPLAQEAPLVQAADIVDDLDTDTSEPDAFEEASDPDPVTGSSDAVVDAGTDLPDGASPVQGAGYQIKGNIRRDGTKIYHEPGSRYYDSTSAEIWFSTPAHAVAAGYRAPRS